MAHRIVARTDLARHLFVYELVKSHTPLLAQRASERFDGLHDLLRPGGDFVVAQGALGGLEADAQEERVRACGERAATEGFRRKDRGEFGDARARRAVWRMLANSTPSGSTKEKSRSTAGYLEMGV